MYDLSDIPLYKWILAIAFFLLKLYWFWIAGAVFTLALWRIVLPVRTKLLITGIAMLLLWQQEDRLETTPDQAIC